MPMHPSARMLALVLVLTVSSASSLITAATAGGLFAVTLYVEPAWAGQITFGSYGTFPSGTTIYVYLGAYQISFVPSSNSSFYSWYSTDGVAVPQEFVYSENGTAVVSGTGTLVAISAAYARSTILTITTTATWSATSTFLTTNSYLTGQSAPSLAPSIQAPSGTAGETAQKTELLQPVTTASTNVIKLEALMGGESLLSGFMFAAALLLSALLLIRHRKREKHR